MSDETITNGDIGDNIILYDDLDVTLTYLGVLAGTPTFQYMNKRSKHSIMFANDGAATWLTTNGTVEKQEKHMVDLEGYVIR